MSDIECNSDMECSDSDCGDTGYEDYYVTQPWDGEMDDLETNHQDPEYAVYECLRVEEVERLLNESVELLSTNLKIKPSLAKLYLNAHEWALQEIVLKFQNNKLKFISNSKINCSNSSPIEFSCKNNLCSVCFARVPVENFSSLNCGHTFCNDCWCTHFETQILQGISTGIKLIFLNHLVNLYVFKNKNHYHI